MGTAFNNVPQLVWYNQILVPRDILIFYITALANKYKMNFLLSKMGIIVIIPAS